MNVIITGASKGMGKALAMAFANEGANLFLCARTENVLAATANEIKKKYPSITVKIKACDLAIKQVAQDFGKWALAEGGSIDILVNNAGLFLPGDTYNEPDGTLENMIETNLYSAYYLTREIVPAMIEKKKGHIFNICSVASLEAYPGGGSYGISKFALMGFSKNLRHELKEHYIKVSAVYPGAVLTDSWKNFDNSDNRIMEAEDISAMIIAATKLSPQAVVEDIILRPQLGDLG
ncbi:MAG: SDR family oxidoreductase [Bacteroidota bacterium]